MLEWNQTDPHGVRPMEAAPLSPGSSKGTLFPCTLANFTPAASETKTSAPDGGGRGRGGMGMLPVEWANAAPHTFRSFLAWAGIWR